MVLQSDDQMCRPLEERLLEMSPLYNETPGQKSAGKSGERILVNPYFRSSFVLNQSPTKENRPGSFYKDVYVHVLIYPPPLLEPLVQIFPHSINLSETLAVFYFEDRLPPTVPAPSP